jgi:hypothetical protein
MPDLPIDPRALLGFDQLADDAHEPTTTSRLLTKVGCEALPPAAAEVPSQEASSSRSSNVSPA